MFNEITKKILLGLVAVLLSVSAYLVGVVKEEPLGRAADVYLTSSSTVYSIGNQLSTVILQARGKRSSASICNNISGFRAFLFLASDATIRATTTAYIAVPANSCYEITRYKPWNGAVSVIQETGSTTNSMIVSELVEGA